MATLTFGQLDSWESEVSGKGTKEDYLRMGKGSDGKYVLRFMTNPPFKFMAHWVELKNGKKTKLNCAGRDCNLCKSGNEANKMFASVVFNRDLGRPQMFDFKTSIFDQIRTHQLNKHWGSLLNYDVEVDRLASRGFKTFITTPLPKEALTKEELAMVAEFSARIDINTHCASMSNEAIEKRLAELNGESYVPGKIAPEVAAAANKAVADDTDFNFT